MGGLGWSEGVWEGWGGARVCGEGVGWSEGVWEGWDGVKVCGRGGVGWGMRKYLCVCECTQFGGLCQGS